VYPCFEFLSGLLAWRLLGVAYGALLFLLISILLLIAYVDYRTMIIYESSLGALLLTTIVLLYFGGVGCLLDLFLGSVSLSGVMLAFNLFKSDCFGVGDIKLMVIMGALLGLRATVEVGIIAVMTAGILAIGKKLAQSDEVYLPFAPFLVGGIIFVLLR
jgi:prepilin signal peptidase PulO-like enzyme (type II secretory pathway)